MSFTHIVYIKHLPINSSGLDHFEQLQKKNFEQVLTKFPICFEYILYLLPTILHTGYNNTVATVTGYSLKYFSHYMAKGRIQIKDKSP